MTTELETTVDLARYASLGLVANPFAPAIESQEPAIECEIAAEGNRLLSVLLERSREDAPKPVWVEKSAELPAYYSLRAISHAEASLARDDSLNVLYAYVQLYMMKIGVVRATLSILSERLSFRSFDQTLALFVESMLAEPDLELPSYGVLGPDGLEKFTARFREDQLATLTEYFGAPEIERHPELAEVADMRHIDLDEDGDDSEATSEIDSTIGDAPGTAAVLAEAAESETDADLAAARDYIIEYAKVHVSPVIARGLRMYHSRGLVAMSEEFKITKAPRKTLDALVHFARLRFNKVAVVFDGFDDWSLLAVDLKSKIVGTMSDMRWKLAGNAFLVLLVESGGAPELEESFGGVPAMKWDFPNLMEVQTGDALNTDAVDYWLSSAALPGATPMSVGDPVLAELAGRAEGSMSRFLGMAFAAVESAAERGVGSLDAEATDAAMAAEGSDL